MQSHQIEITQQIDLLCKSLEEKNPVSLSAQAFLLTKLLAYKELALNASEAQIITSLTAIDLALRAMAMIPKNSETQKVGEFTRFSRANKIEQNLSPLLFSSICQKLQEMIQFYCVPRSKIKNGISRCLSESYSKLFDTKSPISLLIFSTQQDLELFIQNIQSTKNVAIQKCFLTFNAQDFFQEKKNQKTYFYLPLSSLQENTLEKNHFLSTLKITSYVIQEERGIEETPQTLFFELTKNGYQIYCAKMESIHKLKNQLSHFGFKRLAIVTEALPPHKDFQQHRQYLIIPHTQIGKLLALHYQTNTPQLWLNDLYQAKNLNPQKCRLLDRQEKVFEEIDGDFYKEYFDKLHTIKMTSHSILPLDLFSKIFGEFNEDVSFDKFDHRRYLLALFDLQNRFLELTKDELKNLPVNIHQLLDGLKTILIIPENNELLGVSSRLSRHFHQLYQMMEDTAPYVLFESEGCCFYFPSLNSIHTVANQFHIHGINAEILEFASKKGRHDAKVPSHFYHKLIVPANYNHKLLSLCRFHSSNIDIALKQAYGNQGINFISTLLLSLSKLHTTKAKNINASYSVSYLSNGEQVIELRMQTENAQVNTSMGHVIILLDDSGSMNDKKMNAANQACINLINKLPENTKVTLIPFCHQPLFTGCLKSKLPQDWIDEIKAIKGTGNTPLVQTIVKAAASLSSRCFIDNVTLKESTFILLTDGEGTSHETAEEILQAVKTGLFRNKDVSLCNHALGTPELPNHTAFPIIPIGIGNAYDTAVINGLSSFAGNYHIREDDNMASDLSEMTDSITQTFGYKIGPVYAGLVDPLTNEMLISIDIDMMLPATSRCTYIRLPKDKNLEELKVIICEESELSSENLIKSENQNMLVDYFQAQVDALFDTFANTILATSSRVSQDRSSLSRFSQPPKVPITTMNLSIATNSLFPVVKESKFADIIQKLDVLDLEIKDNGINNPILLERIVHFKQTIQNAEINVLNLNDLRRRQAERSRFERGLNTERDDNRSCRKFN